MTQAAAVGGGKWSKHACNRPLAASPLGSASHIGRRELWGDRAGGPWRPGLRDPDPRTVAGRSAGPVTCYPSEVARRVTSRAELRGASDPVVPLAEADRRRGAA